GPLRTIGNRPGPRSPSGRSPFITTTPPREGSRRGQRRPAPTPAPNATARIVKNPSTSRNEPTLLVRGGTRLTCSPGRSRPGARGRSGSLGPRPWPTPVGRASPHDRPESPDERGNPGGTGQPARRASRPPGAAPTTAPRRRPRRETRGAVSSAPALPAA